MLTTEKEATARWCPMVRMAVRVDDYHMGPVAAANQLPGGGATGLCIGGACMMWRWHSVMGGASRKFHVAPDREATDEPPRPPRMPASWEWCPRDLAEGEPAGWREDEATMLARRVGYCGLAGTPAGAA